MRRKLKLSWLALAVLCLMACNRYESQVVPFKLPSAYPNVVTVAGASLAAQAYGEKKEAAEAFGFDIRGAGILPVKVIFDNQGGHALDVVGNQTFLEDVEGNLWPILEGRVAYDRIEKRTQLGEVAPQALKYGGLGGLAGGLIGAAIGIVSGRNVGDAAMRGAAVGAAAGATIGGSKGLTDGEAQAKIRDDLDKRSLQNRSVRPYEIAHGFIFFPGEAKKPTALRLQIREADTGKIHSLMLRF
jgi:hypothetical protein